MDEHLAFRRLYIAAVLLGEQARKHPQQEEDLNILRRYEQRIQQAALEYSEAAHQHEAARFEEGKTKTDGKTMALRRIAFTRIMNQLLRDRFGLEDEVLVATTVSSLLDVL